VQIKWGENAVNGAPVTWDSSRVVNPHIGLFGDTGMGKTHNIQKIINELLETSTHNRLRFHIFDAHGDIEIEGASTVHFHESADFGFNLLELNSDPEFGGIRKRIQSLITAINKTSTRLGHRQERLLTRLLTGLYRDAGFIITDPSTWGLSPERPAYPTLLDAIDYSRQYLHSVYTGSTSAAVTALQDVNKLVKLIRAREVSLQRMGGDDPSIEKLQRDLDAAKQKAILSYTEAVNGVSSGEELDMAIESEGQEETLRAVIDRLENLYGIGIYRSTPPPLDPRNPVWRYVIKALESEEKKLFTMTRLETLFTRAIQRGVQSEIRDVVILDEAHLYLEKEDDYIVNRMVRELRKFGVMMVFATHGLNDYTQSTLAGLGTKIVLGVDHTYRRVAATKLMIDEPTMNFIVPHQRIVAQMKNRGETNTVTHRVLLNS